MRWLRAQRQWKEPQDPGRPPPLGPRPWTRWRSPPGPVGAPAGRAGCVCCCRPGPSPGRQGWKAQPLWHHPLHLKQSRMAVWLEKKALGGAAQRPSAAERGWERSTGEWHHCCCVNVDLVRRGLPGPPSAGCVSSSG